jgi:DNA-binding NtrC family response regulator
MEMKTIAVVDGRAAVHDFVVETLVEAGYTVRGFRSRATFLVEAPTIRPWIILLGADDDAFDVHTPLVLHSLRVAPYRPELPVILYSANPDAAEREKIEDEPDVLPLPAPFTAERLLDAVRDVADRAARAPALM